MKSDYRKESFFSRILTEKAANRNISKNTISSFPKIIAETLKLENNDDYPGHCRTELLYLLMEVLIKLFLNCMIE
jgi:hypothetical protein